MRSNPVIALVILAVATQSLRAADLSLYTDSSLASGWSNWSWNTAANFAVATPHHGSSGTSLGVTSNTGKQWAALYLHATGSFTASDYTSLRFSIHGGAAGGQQLALIPYDGSLAGVGSVTVTSPQANTWTDVEIPMSSFSPTVISGFAWQDISGGAQPVYYLDDIRLIGASSGNPTAVTLTIDAGASKHAISPLIYGLNFANASLAAELGLPVNRWGGNSTTRYNWQTDVSNHASDWYFENLPETNNAPGQLPNGSVTDRFVEGNLASGAESIITVPMIGWTPKPPRGEACGFSVAKYGAQQKTDPYRSDCGNGYHTDGTPITGNNPTDTSMAITGSFVSAWVAHLVGRYGSAAQGGVQFYDLDNEPMLWNSTHRDVHPQGTTYDEMRDRTYEYAAAIKSADPTASTLGPVEWGWCGYFYSAADGCSNGADYQAHGNKAFVVWYLQQMKVYEQAHGTRILDYFDLHYYPQSTGVALGEAGSSSVQALRLRSTRSLWDPTYSDESWITQAGPDGGVIRMIPRMKDWVSANYPGTKLAITEYNWGGMESLNGALAEADVLGIFGREGLDLATMWDPPLPSQPVAFAFRMYRNYDGAGSRFGETSVKGTSSDQSKTSVFAALRQDGKLTAMLVNKNTADVNATLTLTNFAFGSPASVYRYSAADLTHIVHAADLPVSGSGATITLPASSITLLVVPPFAFAPADFDRDTDVDTADLQHLTGCVSGPGHAAGTGCADADLDHDSDVDQSDFGLLQRCLSGATIPITASCLQ